MLAIFQNSGYDVETKFDGESYSISYDITRPQGVGGLKPGT